MFFKRHKPTVTEADKAWIEDAFLFFESTYDRQFLKAVQIIEPTVEFFPRKFEGNEGDAQYLFEQVAKYMDINTSNIELYFFGEAPMEFEDEGTIAVHDPGNDASQKGYALGKYQESKDKIRIGIELSTLKNAQSVVATLAHELSHYCLLAEGRIKENDEFLTDLHTIALGFGIFTSNSIFQFHQWQGVTHQGWQFNRSGYIPEEVAAYAMAMFNVYQGNTTNWFKHLDRSVQKLYLKNIKYLASSTSENRFRSE